MENTLQERLDLISSTGPHDFHLRRQAYVDFFRQYLQSQKEEIFAFHLAGASGSEILSRHSNLIDSIIQAVYNIECDRFISSGKEIESISILAAGGYGRRELQPFSDIDILFLFPQELTQNMGDLVTDILHYLWDIGFELGHSLRSIDDCLRYAREDLASQTSMMESRFVAGDISTFAQLESALNTTVLKDMMTSYVRGKLRELQERHRQYDNSIYHLEPNIKNGMGGLRDLHTALWIAQARFGVRSLVGLQRLGVISETERLATDKSLDFLWKVRNDLHYRANRKQDQLSLQYQDIVAADLGYTNDSFATAVEHFMQDYYKAARQIKEYSLIFIDRCFPPSARKSGLREVQHIIVPGVYQRDGMIHLLDISNVAVDAPLIMRCFLESQRRNLPLAVGTKTLIHNRLSRLSDDDFLHSDAKACFLDMMKETGHLGRALREMHELEVLEKFIPEFAGLTCLVRTDIQHRYTVDEHTLRLIDYLQELKNQTTLEVNNGQPPPKELIQVYHEAKADQVLMLAALLHDIGKSSEKEHVAAGLEIIPPILHRLGLGEMEKDIILFLVKKHLLMSDVCQHHDLDDRRVLSRFASEVLDPERLKLLYCLTYADMRAVGPEIWTPWKAALLLELYHKTMTLLSGKKITESDEQHELELVKEYILSRPTGEVRKEDVDDHFAGMSSRYILGTAPTAIIEHIKMIRELSNWAPANQKQTNTTDITSLHLKKYPLVTSINHNSKVAYSDFTICTIDMPGLFARLTGTLASKGISIIGAQIFTRTDGMVIDTLQLDHRSPGWSEDDVIWEELEEELQKVLSGEKDISAILSARQKQTFAKIRLSSQVETEISLSTEISDTQTVADIRTQDRIGLLYNLTNAMANMGLTITTARIATYGPRAVDVFYFTDIEGNKVTDPARLSAIHAAIQSAIKQ